MRAGNSWRIQSSPEGPEGRHVIHGCFWHSHSCGACRIPAANRKYWLAKIQRNANRDRRPRRALRRLGWRILTIWECQTRNNRLPLVHSRLSRFLNQ